MALRAVVWLCWLSVALGFRWGGLSFTVEPESTVVTQGSPALLHCSAKVSDGTVMQPVISWIRNGEPISEDDRRSILSNGSLSFRWVENYEAGYQCVAFVDGIGKIVSRKADISLLELNKFDAEPENITVFEGERAHFPCSIRVKPKPEIRWFRDNQTLEFDPRMTLLPSGALEIENVVASDEASYHCTATSLAQTIASHEAFLQVEVAFPMRARKPPSFIAKPPSSVKALRGSNMTLECAVNGFPDPTVVWLKEGAIIDMEDFFTRFLFFGATRSLQIINIREEDAGTYTCRAENDVDLVDAVVHLDVEVPPTFLRTPSEMVSFVMHELELACEVYGKPEPSVQWLKDGEVISKSPNFVMEYGQRPMIALGQSHLMGYEHRVKILGLIEEDSGMYQCVAWNAHGYAHTSAKLRVLKSNKGFLRDLYSSPSSANTNGRGTGASERREEESERESEREKRPSKPRNLRTIQTNKRSITVLFTVPEDDDNIISYSVYYKQQGTKRERYKNVGVVGRADRYGIQIEPLTPGTTYEFRVAAQTASGLLGLFSESIFAATEPDLGLPSAPESLTVEPMSSTALRASWDAPENLKTKTALKGYFLYYKKVGSAEQHKVEVNTTSYNLTGLSEYTEYSVRVVAVNSNGVSDATREVTSWTYSDVPSGVPQNATLEAMSSTRLALHWEPPPPTEQNGVIFGYKIRYKESGESGPWGTYTIEGLRRYDVIDGLRSGTQYSVKLAAVTVNGTGPSVQMEAETFAYDLDENQVPNHPTNVEVHPTEDEIVVQWLPPITQNVMVRGYRIGWGRGLPDIYTVTVGSRKRSYTIKGLEPSGEYVVSLRAFNNIGEGSPVYKSVLTKSRELEVPDTLTPPVGLRSHVLSPYTIALQWTDTSFMTDARYYTIRYAASASSASSSPTYQFLNTTEVFLLIDNLKPNTVYEFAVKTVKGRRESPWSLVTSNTTLQAPPSSPPRDVAVERIPGEVDKVVFKWEPPEEANGNITRYVLFYTTDTSGNWMTTVVPGDRRTLSVSGLTPSTVYFYKMQAQNVIGFSPFSSLVNFTTFSVDPVDEQVRTKSHELEVPATLKPPVGLKSQVLSPYSVRLHWTDTTLCEDELLSDTRYYTVRYATNASSASSSPTYQFRNASDVFLLIYNLKPYTAYEFAVKTVKFRRESPWSLVTSNTTLQAPPSSPPRNVTVERIPGQADTVVFKWEPPELTNGNITKYLLIFTVDVSSAWVTAEVPGDRRTFSVSGLIPSTVYYYRILAMNVMGSGPFTSQGKFKTFPATPRQHH